MFSHIYLFVFLHLPLTMFVGFHLEFLLEFLFVRIDISIFSFGLDFVVQLQSRCLLFSLPLRVVSLLTSTFFCVLVLVCYLAFQPLI